MSQKLDVLVTFYNQKEYVDRTLRSIIDQSCNFQFKIIIGDDGSNDGTYELLQKWKEKYPDIISIYQMERDSSKKYIGGFRASQNRLNLLTKVKAPYFIFLDGDDYFTDNTKFQIQVDVLENPKNSDCIMCSHYIEAVFDNGKKERYPWQTMKEEKIDLKKYWSDYYFHTDTSVIRSSSIAKIPVTLIKNHYNDNIITFLALQNGKAYFIPKVMANYAQTGDGIWTSGKTVVNNIRNIFLCDICNKINSDLKKQTEIRFMNAWKGLLKERKKIHSEELVILSEDAKEKRLKYTDMWIYYDKLNVKNKIKLILKSILVILSGYSFKLKRKIRNNIKCRS